MAAGMSSETSHPLGGIWTVVGSYIWDLVATNMPSGPSLRSSYVGTAVGGCVGVLVAADMPSEPSPLNAAFTGCDGALVAADMPSESSPVLGGVHAALKSLSWGIVGCNHAMRAFTFVGLRLHSCWRLCWGRSGFRHAIRALLNCVA